jgi:formylglycine-generating enzyme required for sulfatase activity
VSGLVFGVMPGEGDLRALTSAASSALRNGDLDVAATAYDRACALNPADAELAAARQAVLESLAVIEHGLSFRFVPGGTYLIGSPDGDPDERPVHAVRLDPFWLTDEPVSWAAYCELMDWREAPASYPRDWDSEARQGFAKDRFHLSQENKIRRQYCEGLTTTAYDWHAHTDDPRMTELFGRPPRTDPDAPSRYGSKPMVAVSWQSAEELARHLPAPADVAYRLPREAEWEAAARGGLPGKRYPWGDEPPAPDRCDFGKFGPFAILPPADLPPNGYGLHAMSGTVWEWTADWYDARYYAESPPDNPPGPARGKQRVLRGGSWTDHPETVTVSFRFSRESSSWHDETWGSHLSPNIGFRLCRVKA